MMARVPNVDFLSLNFGNIENSRGSFTYTGPRYAVDKVVAATAAQGNVLALTPPVPNSSWVLDFLGPSIICTGVNDSTLDTIKQNIQAAVAIDQCQISFGYIAWTPTYTSSGDANELSILPFVLSQNSTSYALQNAPLGPFPVGSEDAPLPATFYAALFPNMTDENQEIGGCISCQPCHENPLPDITVIQCELYNSSYYAFFSFIDGEQNINITLDETPHNSVPTTQFLYGDSTEDETAIYNANGTVIAYNTAEVQKLSYQAVMGSFGSVVVGAIWNSKDSSGGIITNGTSVMSTVLGEAEELAWLNSYPPLFESSASTFQQTIALDPSGRRYLGENSVFLSGQSLDFLPETMSQYSLCTEQLLTRPSPRVLEWDGCCR
jgi:hypothetical protein